MKKTLLLTSLIAGIIIGCGDNNNNSNDTIEGQFIDSPVAGLKYESKSFNGTTDENGKYKCKIGETISFFAGDNKIGETSCASIITPLNLANNDSNMAANIAYFLQNLDTDKNPSNGIKIPDNIPNLKIDFKNLESIDTALNNLGINPTISLDKAYNNLINDIAQINQNNNESNTNNSSNENLSSYQCVATNTWEGYTFIDAISVNSKYIKVEKKDYGDYTDCYLDIIQPIYVKEVYSKEDIASYENFITGEKGSGYIEYYYPSGKVHYHVTNSLYGSVDCTATFDTSYLNGIIASEDDLYEYIEFDDNEYLKDKGNCPDWVFEEDDDEDDDNPHEVYKAIDYIKITDKNNEISEIKEYHEAKK